MKSYLLEIHEEFDDGTPEKDVKISKSVLTDKELIGAEIIEILPDDLGDMFTFRLKDKRVVVFFQGEEGLNYYFVQVKTLEQKNSQDIPVHQ